MKLTLQQKIGQMMIVGFQTTNKEDAVELIKKYNFGNIILFTRNITSAEQLKSMTEAIQEAALKYNNGIPAFIALDQEGGSIRRIYSGVSNVPGHMAIGAASNKYPEVAYQIGSIVGKELKVLGINCNLAPVADINTNPFNPIIGIRAFSSNPMLVEKLANDYARGLQENGVLAVYKHFIGHGDVNIDSHLDLPHLSKSKVELLAEELIPYKNEIRSDAVMPAHILYDQLDDRFPVSTSEKLLKGLLREELGYEGLIISDCFEMDALQRAFSLGEAAVFAVNATMDIVMVSHSFGKQLMVRNDLLKAAKSGAIKKSVIDESLKRILKAKEIYTKEKKLIFGYEKNQEKALKYSLASVTLASGEIFPIDQNTVVVGVTNFLNSVAEDANVENMDIAKILGEEFNIAYRSIDNKNFNVNEILNFCKGKKVILGLTDSHLTLIQKVLYSNLIQSNQEVMLISLRTPYDVLGQDLPACHLCVYEYTKLSVASLIQVLRGKKAEGILPVDVETKINYGEQTDIKNYIIRDVIGYLEANFRKKLSLGFVAEEHYVSASHLSRLFKKETNMNFVEYLTMIRIDYAKKMLQTSQLKIYEVASLSGFTDVNYFTKVFKRIIGSTPLEYRNNYGYFD
ncbi:MAG: beta-N-acetylhexosaminidase [Acholeplasmataceae bacterium]|nr:beta-N-acetylhexosaminidase [Acholeplasmataceae bacterium]